MNTSKMIVNIALMGSIVDMFSTIGYEFYACTACPSDIRLQGRYNSEAVKLAKSLEYDGIVTDQGYTELLKVCDNLPVTIVLT